MGAFWEGLATLGWVEGRNLRIDYRFSGGDPSRLARAKHKLQAVVHIVTVVPSVRFPAECCPCSESSSAFAAGQVKHQATPEGA
jgi:hypothetical protein